jgi:hypothetical protein
MLAAATDEVSAPSSFRPGARESVISSNATTAIIPASAA